MQTTKTILILTDSLGTPRPDTPYTDTWVHHIIEAYRQTCHCFAHTERALTSTKLRNIVNEKYALFTPDILLIQVGLADCAPRALSEKEQAFISKIPFVCDWVKAFIKRNYHAITKKRNLCYVSQINYKKNLDTILNTFPTAQKILIPIITPCHAYREKSPMIAERITAYNAALIELKTSTPNTDIISELNALPESLINDNFYIEDHHHLTKKGHLYYTEKINDKIRNFLAQ